MQAPVEIGQYTFDLVASYYAERTGVSRDEAYTFCVLLLEEDWSAFYGLLILAEFEKKNPENELAKMN